MKKKYLALLVLPLIFILVGSFLTGPVKSASKTELRWYLRWDNARLEAVAKPVIEDYQKLNPNVEIILENVGSGNEYWMRLQTMLAADSCPDVVYPATHQAYLLSQNKQLINLMPFVKRDKIDLKAYIPAVLDFYMEKDVLFGLPIDTASLVIFYNKDMFDEAGVPYPTDNMTWDELITMSKKLVKDKDGDGRIDQYALHLDSNIYWKIVTYHMTGKMLFDDLKNPTKLLLKNKDQIQAIQYFADMMVKHHIAPTPSMRADISDMFLAGNAAMNIIGHWRVPTYNKSVKFNWDVAALPRGKYPANRGDGSCFAISKDTKNPEAAWEFVKYLAGPDAPGVKKLLSLGQMVPAQTALLDSDLFLKTPGQRLINKKAFLAWNNVLLSPYQPFHEIFNEVDNTIRAAFAELWEGKISAEQAVKNATPKLETLLLEASL